MENGQVDNQEANQKIVDLVNGIVSGATEPTTEENTAVAEVNEEPLQENADENQNGSEQAVEQKEKSDEAKTNDASEDALIILPDSELDNIPNDAKQGNLPDLSDIFGTEVKSKEDIKNYIDNLKKEKETVFANDTVKALNDYLKSGGGNEKEFLDAKIAQTETEKVIKYINEANPIEIYKQDLMLPLEEGGLGLTPEEVEEYINSKSELDLKIEGNKAKLKHLGFQQEILKNQKQQEVAMIKNVEAKNEAFKTTLQTYVKELKEVDGIQVSDSDKKNLSRILDNPTAYIRTAFPLDANGLPTKDWAVNAMRLYNNKRLVTEIKNKVSKAVSEGAKAVFNEIHNVENPKAVGKQQQPNTEVNEAEMLLKEIRERNKVKHY